MTLYIDRLNAVWMDVPVDEILMKEYHWELVSVPNDEAYHRLYRGYRYTDSCVKNFKPFVKIDTGEEYQFPEPLKAGDAVDVDYKVLSALRIDFTRYRPARHTVVGSYEYTTDDGEYVVLSTSIKVPAEAVKRY